VRTHPGCAAPPPRLSRSQYTISTHGHSSWWANKKRIRFTTYMHDLRTLYPVCLHHRGRIVSWAGIPARNLMVAQLCGYRGSGVRQSSEFDAA
jgi:hypothetical protein